MPTTQERRAAARQTDQEIKDRQLAQVTEDRKERDARLGIGQSTGATRPPAKKTAEKRTATKKTTAKKATKKTAAKKA